MIESDAVLYISDNWYMNTIKIVVNDSGDVIFIKYELFAYIITIKNYNILLSISDETTNENIHLVVLMEVDAS